MLFGDLFVRLPWGEIHNLSSSESKFNHCSLIELQTNGKSLGIFRKKEAFIIWSSDILIHKNQDITRTPEATTPTPGPAGPIPVADVIELSSDDEKFHAAKKSPPSANLFGSRSFRDFRFERTQNYLQIQGQKLIPKYESLGRKVVQINRCKY
jgi:hypothetical protein